MAVPSQFESFNPKPGSAQPGARQDNSTTALPGIRFAEVLAQDVRQGRRQDQLSSVQCSSERGGSLPCHQAGAQRLPDQPDTSPTPPGARWLPMQRYDAAFELPAFVRIGKSAHYARAISTVRRARRSKYESFKIDEPGKLPPTTCLPTVVSTNVVSNAASP